jgi:hypothetical protein
MTEENLEKGKRIAEMLVQFRREREVVSLMRKVELDNGSECFGDGDFYAVTFSKDNDMLMVNAVKELVLRRLDEKIAYYSTQLEML